jgi:hypothetical protein
MSCKDLAHHSHTDKRVNLCAIAVSMIRDRHQASLRIQSKRDSILRRFLWNFDQLRYNHATNDVDGGLSLMDRFGGQLSLASTNQLMICMEKTRKGTVSADRGFIV